MKETAGLRTWIELNKKSLTHNYEIFRSRINPATKCMAVIKSNAYGHGLFDVAPELEKLGVDWLGVDSITEAVRLRKEGITIPILVLGYTLPERVLEAVENNISLTVSSFDTLEIWSKLKLPKEVSVHIKVDTGLHRQGFFYKDAEALINFLKKSEDVFMVEGLYTHFAEAKNPASKEYTNKQIEEFKLWITEFKKSGFSPITHAAATSSLLVYPEAQFDMVRVGAGVYGIWPSEAVKKNFENEFSLEPVLSWKTLIAEKKNLEKGMAIGYDLSETLTRDSYVAICPIGYWHGFPRSLSSVGEVLINGKRAKVLGKVAMDMIVVDVTDIPHIKIGEEVTLIGRDGTEEITAEEFAKKAGTTSYEILTRLNPLIKKIYI